jgi:hypothetical protein
MRASQARSVSKVAGLSLPSPTATATSSPSRRMEMSGVPRELVGGPLGLVAEDGGAFAHLDLDARFGRDLPDESGEVDLAAAPSGHGVAMEGGERGDGLVEAVQRALDAAAAFIRVRLVG